MYFHVFKHVTVSCYVVKIPSCGRLTPHVFFFPQQVPYWWPVQNFVPPTSVNFAAAPPQMVRLDVAAQSGGKLKHVYISFQLSQFFIALFSSLSDGRHNNDDAREPKSYAWCVYVSAKHFEPQY